STRLNWFSPRCPVITGGGPQDPPLPPPPASMPRSALPIASPLPPRSRSSSHLLLPTPPLPTLSGPRVETFIRCPTARGGYHNHGSSLPSITSSGAPLEHEGHQRGSRLPDTHDDQLFCIRDTGAQDSQPWHQAPTATPRMSTPTTSTPTTTPRIASSPRCPPRFPTMSPKMTCPNRDRRSLTATTTRTADQRSIVLLCRWS